MKEPEDCMAGAAREASALMGSGAAGEAQAASSGKAGGGGKGGEGGALRGALVTRCRTLASCSRRIWCCSCWIFRGSLGREREATPSERALGGGSLGAARVLAGPQRPGPAGRAAPGARGQGTSPDSGQRAAAMQRGPRDPGLI